MAPGAPSQVLPSKEAGLFKQIVKLYEQKQYKKGLKTVEQVLKKCPQHGETLAMKGLIVSCLGDERKEEAYKLVREGVKYDVRSYVCWHVYGLLYRADRNYAEAIKCYRNALRLEKENVQIMRDLCLLQAQCHDWEGFAETRRQLLVLKPSQRNNWIGFAVAQHMAGKHAEALDIVAKYEGTLESVPPEGEEYEHSELQMYKSMVLEESGDKAGALKLLQEQEKHIVDKLGLQEATARLKAETGDSEGAVAAYAALVERNPDHLGYHAALREAKGLAGDTPGSEAKAALLALYADLSARHPKAVAPRRLPLDFLDGEDFESALELYMRPFLTKGVPSLYSDLSKLQEDPARAAIMTKVIAATVDSLRAGKGFAGPAREGEGAPGPATLMWALLLQAQHLGLGLSPPRFDDALAAIDEAIAHTPTVVDLYVAKGDILAAAGDDEGAAELCDEARSMDLADRYLNSKAAMMMMRAGKPELAEERASMFAKDPDGGPQNNLFDMQCMWYELEAGAAWEERRDTGRALKKLLAVETHYNDIDEDQFDFHSYCLRKMTLRAYVKMLRMEDRLREKEPFRRAAAGAVRLFCGLHDVPAAEQNAAAEEALYAGMSAIERKRAKQKARKEEQRRAKAEEARLAKEAADREAAEAEAAKDGKEKRPSAPPKPADPDPHGARLAATETPLDDALRLLKHLEATSASLPLTHALSHDVHSRRDKPLLALVAVKKGVALDAADPDVHLAATRFFARHGADGTAGGVEGPMVGAIAAEAAKVLGGAASALEYARAWQAANGGRSVAHAAAAATALAAAGAPAAEAAQAVLSSAFGAPGTCEHAGAVAAHKALSALGGDGAEAAAREWHARCARAWPHSRHFGGAKYAARAEAASAARADAAALEEGEAEVA